MAPPQPGPDLPPPTQSAPEPTGPAAERARRLAAAADSTLDMIALVARAAHTLAEPEHAPAYPPLPHPSAEDIATIIRAHTALTRSLRQTCALEAKLEALAAAGPLAAIEAETRRIHLRKTLIRKVENAIDTNARPEARENLLHEFYERLDDPELGTDLDRDLLTDGPQPTIAEACRDLGIFAATDAYPRRTPTTLTHLLARATAHPTTTGPP